MDTIIDYSPQIQMTATPIESHPDFSVRWENPQDATYHWTRDCEHNPQPITPMFSSVAALTAGEGRRRTVEVYEEAIVGRRDLQFNGYNFTRLLDFQGTPQEIEDRIRRNREKVGAVSLRLTEAWEREWRPELEEHWAFWAAFDLETASSEQLFEHLQETIRRCTRVYEIHYLMGPPMWFAIAEFEDFYCDLFPAATALDAQRLLQGFDNKTLGIGRRLWQLSRMALASPAVQAVFANTPTAQVCAKLKNTVEGCRFLGEFQQFLQAYGRRSDLWDWGYPSWEEDPAPLINNLKNYLRQPGRDLIAEQAQAAAEREAAIRFARSSLGAYPAAVVERFETLLQAAQTALVLSEDHTYWIDFNGFGWVHRVIREFGQRLADQGRLFAAADVFYLTIAELQVLWTDSRLDLARQALERRAEIRYWSTVEAPLELGTRPTRPLRAYSPDAKRMARYTGCFMGEEPLQPIEPGILRGQPGSAGCARGRARVILSLADAHRLHPGDILVTVTTAPPWTPLFLTAAGLVTDAGGILSHGAVVSREYRIPAVVGTRAATRQIRDGQWIEVDGSSGTVRILDR
jgi:pyruvate,water dikinase